ncbi:MAG: hypothetical protein ACI857_002314 [Arenicella sp.]|jgi:hypothetical protein
MRLLITSILLSMGFGANSQVWVDQNAVWHYDVTGLAYQGFDKIEYTQDSLVGGELCQMFEKSHYRFLQDQLGQWNALAVATTSPEFTYVNGDTVFYWRDSQFFILFDFGASVGDQWQIGSTDPHSGDFLCDDSSFVAVTATGNITINSTSYRTITLEKIGDSSIGSEGLFVERFGFYDSNTIFQLFPRGDNCDANVVVEWEYSSFKCFTDDSFVTHNPSGEDCEYLLTHLGNSEMEELDFKLFPNPVTDNLSINYSGIAKVEILDYLGRTVYLSKGIKPSVIQLSGFDSGVYFVRLTKGDEVGIKKFFKQ